MKKSVALTLVLMFLFTGIGHAEAEGVNLMEFARRYYRAMDIIGAESSEPMVGDTPCVVFNGTVVYFDEMANVTKVFMFASHTDIDAVYSMYCVLIALSVPYGDISESSFSDGLLNGTVYGDYEATSASSSDTGLMVIFELR